MRGIQRDTADQCFFDDPLGKIASRDLTQRMKQQRMMRNDQIQFQGDRLVDDLFGHVHAQQYPGHFRFGMSHVQSAIVVFFLQGQGGESFDPLYDFLYFHIMISLEQRLFDNLRTPRLFLFIRSGRG